MEFSFRKRYGALFLALMMVLALGLTACDTEGTDAGANPPANRNENDGTGDGTESEGTDEGSASAASDISGYMHYVSADIGMDIQYPDSWIAVGPELLTNSEEFGELFDIAGRTQPDA